jgi:hypothetical protein
MIKHKSFKHGWFYHYRIHEEKTCGVCKNFSSLSAYLYHIFDDCPNDYFNSGPRSSSLRIDINAILTKEKNHEVSILAKEGLSLNEYKTAHSNVQMFMLNFDKNTLGIEVPIWLMPEEIPFFEAYFKENFPLTGHIDVLQIKDDKIWIWDYKPKAHLEKYAKTQTYFYALMLSKRTDIPLENFMCGYFDENIALTFDPAKVKLPIPITSLIQ